MGSLIAALASYLDARARSGEWLLRMEDLDPPREPVGAAETILRQLEALHLHWDGPVLYQSERLDAYQAVLDTLAARDLIYRCDCTRQRLKTLHGVYDGHCRNNSPEKNKKSAARLQVANSSFGFVDRIQGAYEQNLQRAVGDFVVRRKDLLFAYQLAVVVDDEFQQITDIVRGYDLLDSTPRQIYLQQLLGYRTPNYAHFPVIVNATGQKLSKQHFAAPVETSRGVELIFLALQYLGLSPSANLSRSDCDTLLSWAIENWDIQLVPKLANIPESAD